MRRIYADFESFIREHPPNQRHQRSIKVYNVFSNLNEYGKTTQSKKFSIFNEM